MDLLNHPDIKDVERSLCSNTNHIVFFVGAGLSRPLGLPLWNELLNELIDYGQTTSRLDRKTAKTARQLVDLGQYLTCGSLLKREMGERLTQRLHEIFSRPSSGEFGIYEHLVRLPCAGFITTNYDTLLEDAYAKVWGRALFPVIPTNAPDLSSAFTSSPFLIKLHGDVRTRTFVLAEKDYAALENNQPLTRFLYGIYFKHRVVFLGYGLADDDIVTPLRLFSRDYPRTPHRHLAIMPRTIRPEVRVNLEDDVSINVALYDPDPDHSTPQDIVFNWVMAVKASHDRRLMFDDPKDCAELLRRQPQFMGEYLANIADRALDWLWSLPVRWGGVTGSGLRAANLAQGLIPLEMGKQLLKKNYDINEIVQALLTFQRPDGGFASVTWNHPNVQTHALSVYALSLYSDYGPEVQKAVAEGRRWLLNSFAQDNAGFGRRAGAKVTRTIPSIWSFAALLSSQEFPLEQWRVFREKLLETGVIDHVIGGHDQSVAAAGTLLWLMGDMKRAGIHEPADEELIDIAFEHLIDNTQAYNNEDERFPFGDTVGTEDPNAPIAWVSWIHSAAPAVVTGIVPFLERRPDVTWQILGKAIARLIQQANAGLDGHLKDSTSERAEGATFMFHTQYAVWAICIYLQSIKFSSSNP